MIGTLLGGRFRLERKLGSGGMSTVYRAFDETLERWVAIKLMHADITTDAAAIERFRREARAVARLSHPHVVSVIDAGDGDGDLIAISRFRERTSAEQSDELAARFVGTELKEFGLQRDEWFGGGVILVSRAADAAGR
jgi:serine/threonine-protein kinase